MYRLLAAFAAVLIVLSASTASAALIADGSFEDRSGGTGWVSSIAGWSTGTTPTTGAAQRLGLFFRFDGFTARHKKVFAALTNAGGGPQTLQNSVPFTIENLQLQVAYVYATKNAPGSTTHVDPFTVTLISTDPNTMVTTSTTYTAADTNTKGLGIGNVGGSPFNIGNLSYDTGSWKFFNIDVTNLKGHTGTLVFQIGDSVTGTSGLSDGGTSGVFIDRVAQVPEPGTFALFGLGLVGLGLYGRRKWKRR